MTVIYRGRIFNVDLDIKDQLLYYASFLVTRIGELKNPTLDVRRFNHLFLIFLIVIEGEEKKENIKSITDEIY